MNTTALGDSGSALDVWRISSPGPAALQPHSHHDFQHQHQHHHRHRHEDGAATPAAVPDQTGLPPYIFFDGDINGTGGNNGGGGGGGGGVYDYYESAASGASTAVSPTGSSRSLSPAFSNEDILNHGGADAGRANPNSFDPQLLHPGTAMRNPRTFGAT